MCKTCVCHYLPKNITIIRSSFFTQDKCHNVADKYIECEPIIILIDLILLSQPAYRHILYNTHFTVRIYPPPPQKYWIGFIIVFCI